MGTYAFQNCTSLTSINIPNKVISIGANAFSDSGLTSITIPSTVTSIGSSAFSGSGLTSITIPSTVTKIEYSAFIKCTNLTSVTFEGSIQSANFGDPSFSPFYGDLRDKYFASTGGGTGTYTTDSPVSDSSVWTKTP
ncbi:leucine-rich repeat domain-containing protein [Treponema sp. R6D11]